MNEKMGFASLNPSCVLALTFGSGADGGPVARRPAVAITEGGDYPLLVAPQRRGPVGNDR